MGLESLSRTAHVKEGSQGTAVLDVEEQEIVEEVQKTTDDTDKAPNEHDQVIVALRKLESSLDGYLGNHIQEIKNLHEAALLPVVNAEDLDKRDNSNGTKDSGHATASHIYTHVKHIDEFLKSYTENVRVLQKRLQQNDGQADNDVEIDEVKYKSMLEQFNMQLLVSTFTAGIILAWCSLVKVLQINGAHAELLYNVGLLLSLLAIAFHFFNILLSGRCVALCSDHTDLKDHNMRYFYNVLETCEQLYLHGMMMFGVAVLEMTFIMFDQVVYPAVFCGAVALGMAVLAAGQFRKLSVLYQNMIRIKALAWRFGRRVGRKR